MNERIKELAEQAGFELVKTNNGYAIWTDEGWNTDLLERFAELVRQDEREQCAKLCDELDQIECATAGRGATAIRARRKTHD